MTRTDKKRIQIFRSQFQFSLKASPKFFLLQIGDINISTSGNDTELEPWAERPASLDQINTGQVSMPNAEKNNSPSAISE